MEFVPFGAVDKIKLSLSIIKTYIAKPTKSGATCSDRDAMGFMMLCQAQRLNPFAGDAFLTGYDSKSGPTFSLITAHVAFLKRAESSKEYEGMESGVVIKKENGEIIDREGDFAMGDEEVVGGWARVHRTGRKPTYKRLHIAQRKPEYTTSFWEGAKANEQIVKCAEADALRATFPSLLGGLPTQGEIVNVESVVMADSPKQAAAAPMTIAQVSKEPTAQAMLAALLTDNGHTFDDFQRWAVAENQIKDADSLTGFDDVSTENAKRLVRAKAGLLAALKAGKVGV